MRSQARRPIVWPALVGTTLLALAARGSYGQGPYMSDAPRVAQTPQTGIQPRIPTPTTPTAPPAPEAPITERGAPPTPPEGLPSVPPTEPAAAFAGAFGPEQFAATGGQTVAIADNVGYIDSAIIRSRFRLRFDAAYNLNSPDRGEYFYPKCGCFGNPMNSPGAIITDPTTGKPVFDTNRARQMGYDPRALGPQHIMPKNPRNAPPGFQYPGDPRIDYQMVAPYLEYAPNARNSFFIETPARFLNPTLVKNAYGWSDMNLGFKHAFVANPDQFYTFQFRTYVPTGSGDRGLGTNHASLEPGLLVFQRLSERLYFSGEFLDWIPVHATNFAGNILNYGAGLTYNVVLTQHLRVAPVNEFVGWTLLSGKELVPDPTATTMGFNRVKDVAGQTIVNYKVGLRIGLGNYSQAGGGSALNDRHSFYVGYGHALTGEHWYRDVLRLEYNFWF